MEEGRRKFTEQKMHDIRSVTSASLSIMIAERPEEIEPFKKLTDIIAIQIVKEKDYTDMRMFGPINQKFPDLHTGVLPCTRLRYNRNLPFRIKDYGSRTFNVAMGARYQIQRQGESGATLATFKLKKLKA